MNKTTKIVLGSAAAIGLLGGGTALAVANNNASSADSSTSDSSVSVVSPGTQQGPGGSGQMGEPPADGGQGKRGGGFIADALSEALGIDAETVATAVEEVESELGIQGRPDFQSTEFIDALAAKLGVSSDQVSEALSSMPGPGGGGQPPADGGTAPSAAPSASASADPDA